MSSYCRLLWIRIVSVGGWIIGGQVTQRRVAELDQNRNAYELSELHEPRKRVSFRVKAFNSSYLEEVPAQAESENWSNELLGQRESPIEFPIELPSVEDPFWSHSKPWELLWIVHGINRIPQQLLVCLMCRLLQNFHRCIFLRCSWKRTLLRSQLPLMRESRGE